MQQLLKKIRQGKSVLDQGEGDHLGTKVIIPP